MEGKTTLNAFAFTVFFPGSRTREDPGADETHDLRKENNSNEEVRGRNSLQK